MTNIIKWFKKKFKAVYCEECKHYGKEGLWSGDHQCDAHPHTYTIETNSESFIKRPKKEKIKSYKYCEHVRRFPWCSKFKEKDK